MLSRINLYNIKNTSFINYYSIKSIIDIPNIINKKHLNNIKNISLINYYSRKSIINIPNVV